MFAHPFAVYSLISLIVFGIGISVYWIPKIMLDIVEYKYPDVLFRTSRQRYKKSRIFLTFDDVPYKKEDSPPNFEKILEELNRYEMKATFFIMSDEINEKTRKLLVQAVQQGHLLGNHGTKDCYHILLDLKEWNKQIDSCEWMIDSIYKSAKIKRPDQKFYRPGGGPFSTQMIENVKKKGMRLCLGSVYPYDAHIKNPIINEWYLKHHISDGDIVVLHDRPWTIDLLPKLFRWIQSQNFDCAPLNEIF